MELRTPSTRREGTWHTAHLTRSSPRTLGVGRIRYQSRGRTFLRPLVRYRFVSMVRYYCGMLSFKLQPCVETLTLQIDYCDAYLTHDSGSVRKQHNSGFKHKANVRAYYSQFILAVPRSNTGMEKSNILWGSLAAVLLRKQAYTKTWKELG